ncbi:MAG: phosphatase PAP2 family protein [Verrucomicrobiota bacterium]
MNALRNSILITSLGASFLLTHPNLIAKENPKYLPQGAVDGAAIIGPPPALDSNEFQAEMKTVLWLQRTRTPEQIAFAQTTLDVERFTPTIGSDLFATNARELMTILNIVVEEVRLDYDVLKAKFDVPRPFVRNKKVKPIMKARKVPSYPSGHAIRSIVWARLLSDVFPDKREALMQLAYQIGYGRVIAGLHYPADVIAGQKLGNAYADAILKNPVYQSKIASITTPRTSHQSPASNAPPESPETSPPAVPAP